MSHPELQPTEELVSATRERIQRANVRFINLQFTDVVGHVKSVTIPVERLEGVLDHGHWFDGSSIEGFARSVERDMYLVPDLSTFSVIPWEQDGDVTARIICWIFNPRGDVFPGDPRAVLARALQTARDLGYRYNTGPEIEFFLLRTQGGGRISPLPHDQAGYFDSSTDLAANVRKEMMNVLQAMGIRVESSHHEGAAGQHEIDFEYDEALTSADNTMTFKHTLKAIAQRYNLHATFMPKPFQDKNGSGMHVHQSLMTLDGENAFADGGDEYGLSDVARHFIAGQIAHARGMSAILAPLVNSYKRLVPGFEAPVYLTWARVNRSALVRVPRTSEGKLRTTRLELRCPDPACNPYLAFAAMLHAGLDGVRTRMPLPEPIEESLYAADEASLAQRHVEVLPRSLGDALDALRRDEVIQNALGTHVLERFLEAKTIEWEQYQGHVSGWEIERYLEQY
ncbi:MAG: type I glutamate--ammonia ligase [Chloroflexi bacterium]|nr:type I glutamate--ammonia ligase [Chloroflexota bacterium]